MDVDEWQWLEGQTAPECLAWVDQQNQATTTHLDALPGAKQIRDRLRALTTTETRLPDFWLAGHLFRLRKTTKNQEGILEVAPTLACEIAPTWQKVIDIDEIGLLEGKSFKFRSYDLSSCVLGPDPWRMLLLLSPGGSRTVELREVDIERGCILHEGGFNTSEGHVSVAWVDADHILINHDLNGGPVTKAGMPLNTYIWRRNTPLSEAKLIHSAENEDTVCFVKSVIVRSQRRGLLLRAIDLSTFVLYLVSPDGSTQIIPLPQKLNLFSMSATSEHIIVSMGKPSQVCGADMPAGTVVAYDLTSTASAEKRTTVVYSPRNGEVNAYSMQGGLKASRSKVYLVITNHAAEQVLEMQYLEGSWTCLERKDVGIGCHMELIASDSRSEHIVQRQSGLLTPASTWLVCSNETRKVLHEQPAMFDSDLFTVERKTTKSRDGTEVDYIMIYPRSVAVPDTNQRVLMTGYGAFGISMPMDYLNHIMGGVSLVPWYESGGAVVIALIRGGGEHGEDWHRAAMLENRQRSYDDFACVTEKLIADGFTTPGRIGVFGTSNGGLLAAVMGTQRPELYSAIVSDVPLSDMLRYPYIGVGAAWISEFGDPEDPSMKPILRSYSPYHNINSDTKYPAFLVTISTKDDLVGAGHARKLVARLQQIRSPNTFLFEAREGGHVVSDPFINTPLMARRMAFLMKQLDGETAETVDKPHAVY